jgi:serine/threonine protein kinase
MLTRGQQLGRYLLLDAVGAGGMGQVYVAEDSQLGRKVAIKVLLPELADDSDRMRRFIQEAKATSALNHPNIVTIHEIREVDSTRFIVTEYIEGETLSDRLERGLIELRECLKIAIQIASAVGAAHSVNIVHRDIKPGNIMIRPDGLVKIVDFGIAKLTGPDAESADAEAATKIRSQTLAGTIIGTAAYMSPEQAQGKVIDGRSDIFSFGVVLYEMLSGKQPFEGNSALDVIGKILHKEPVPVHELVPSVPAELQRIVAKSLEKDRGDRYQTADELLEDLRKCEEELTFHLRYGSLDVANQQQAPTRHLEIDTSELANTTADSHDVAPTPRHLLKSLRSRLLASNRSLLTLLALLMVIGTASFAYLLVRQASPEPKSESVKLFEIGQDALRDGTYFKASKLLLDAVELDGEFPKARAALAESWMELDYLQRAQAEMLRANELQRKQQTFIAGFFPNEDSLHIEAVNASIIRDFPQAIAAYQKILEKDPSEPGTHVDLGRAYEKNEEIDKAIASYEKAVSLNGQYAAAFMRLGRLLARKAEYVLSEENFARAESIYDRMSNDEGVAEVKYQRGVSLNLQEKLDDAKLQFEQVISNPRASKFQQIRALLQISSLCSGRGDTVCGEENASNAMRLAEQERMGNLVSAGLIDVGNSFLARGEYDRAEEHFQRALEYSRKDGGTNTEARALLALGSLSIQRKKPDDAENYVRQALPFFEKGGYKKEIAQANLLLGRANHLKGDRDAALAAFALVANSEGSAPADRAYAELASGLALVEAEKFPLALRHLEQSYSLYRTLDNPYYTAFTLLGLADTLSQLGRFSEAMEKVTKVEESLVTSPPIRTLLAPRATLTNARIALINRNFTEAIKLSYAEKEGSSKFDALKIMGLAQANSNPVNLEALKSCNKALDHAIATNDAAKINDAKLILGETLLRTGNPLKALEVAIPTKDYFLSVGRLESAWRAWILAAQASHQTGDTAGARHQASEGLNVLRQIENDWGQIDFKTYIARPDINLYFLQAQKLAASS